MIHLLSTLYTRLSVGVSKTFSRRKRGHSSKSTFIHTCLGTHLLHASGKIEMVFDHQTLGRANR